MESKQEKALSATLDELKTPPRQPAPLVTESTQKERDFQRRKALKRKAEALSDGLLLQDEVTPALQAEATRTAKASQQSDRQRKKKRTDYLVAAKMTSKKKLATWACQGLPEPAWLDPRLGDRASVIQQKLRMHGVSAVCQDSDLYMLFNLLKSSYSACLYIMNWQDLKQAKLIVVANFSHVEDRVKIMAALLGAVVLSASVLLGKAGVKLEFHRGLDIDVAVFVTHAFKAAEPGLTSLLRDACRSGWHAVRANDLKGRGRKPSLLLRQDGEVVQGFTSKSTVKCFNGVDFCRWLLRTCVNQRQGARICAAES